MLVYKTAADWVFDSHSLAPISRHSEVPFVGNYKLELEVGSKGVITVSRVAFA